MAIIKKIILFAILLVPFNNASAMQFVQKVWNSIPDVTFWPEIEDGQELPAQSPALAAQPHAEDAAQDADMPPAQAPQPAARPAVPVPDRVAPVVPDVPEVEQQVGAPANPEDHAPVADVQPAAQEDLAAPAVQPGAPQGDEGLHRRRVAHADDEDRQEPAVVPVQPAVPAAQPELAALPVEPAAPDRPAPVLAVADVQPLAQDQQNAQPQPAEIADEPIAQLEFNGFVPAPLMENAMHLKVETHEFAPLLANFRVVVQDWQVRNAALDNQIQINGPDIARLSQERQAAQQNLNDRGQAVTACIQRIRELCTHVRNELHHEAVDASSRTLVHSIENFFSIIIVQLDRIQNDIETIVRDPRDIDDQPGPANEHIQRPITHRERIASCQAAAHDIERCINTFFAIVANEDQIPGLERERIENMLFMAVARANFLRRLVLPAANKFAPSLVPICQSIQPWIPNLPLSSVAQGLNGHDAASVEKLKPLFAFIAPNISRFMFSHLMHPGAEAIERDDLYTDAINKTLNPEIILYDIAAQLRFRTGRFSWLYNQLIAHTLGHEYTSFMQQVARFGGYLNYAGTAYRAIAWCPDSVITWPVGIAESILQAADEKVKPVHDPVGRISLQNWCWKKMIATCVCSLRSALGFVIRARGLEKIDQAYTHIMQSCAAKVPCAALLRQGIINGSPWSDRIRRYKRLSTWIYYNNIVPIPDTIAEFSPDIVQFAQRYQAPQQIDRYDENTISNPGLLAKLRQLNIGARLNGAAQGEVL